ncbi:MAG TPA: sugar-binding domain-containing protein, partial [Micavibrio sp.]
MEKKSDVLFEVDSENYPRPQFVRSRYQKLNGEWDFAFDDENRGLAENWQASTSLDKKIIVPFPYQSKASGLDDKTIHETVWYKKNFTVPEDWKETSSQDLILHFGAVDYECAVYINGQEACTNEGGHVPFSLNITPYLNEDGRENQITVRIVDKMDADQPRGKQSTNGQSHSI